MINFQLRRSKQYSCFWSVIFVKDVEHFIPLEDIRAFQARHPELAQKREEWRKNLRMRFDQLCTYHKSACQ